MKILYNRNFLDTFDSVPVLFKSGDSFTLPEIVNTVINRKQEKKWFRQPKWVVTAATQYTAIKHEQYPLVKYLVDEKGYQFEAALVIAANLCIDCLNIALLEIQLDYNGIKTYKPSNDEVKCVHCEKRKKLYDRKQFTTSTTIEEKGEGISL